MKTVAEMNDAEREQTRDWLKRWQESAPELEEVRAQEIRETDTVQAMKILDGMFTHAVLDQPARQTSGLVEQQAIFHRGR